VTSRVQLTRGDLDIDVRRRRKFWRDWCDLSRSAEPGYRTGYRLGYDPRAVKQDDPKRFGDYELHRRLGVGGMAEVFEATRGRGKPVALKRLLPQLRHDESIVTSFIDEAQICAELSHPHVVAVYDFGEAEDTYYMTMELLDGPDLMQLLTRSRNQKRTLPVQAVAYIGYQLALGLHYIHTHPRAIVHRDVTPHNVFLTRDGVAKLADFGVAFAKERLTETKAGFVKGKLSYLAPEQVRGDPVTARTDVFAAGLLLYEMLTGERANRADADLKLIEWAMNPSCPAPSTKVPTAKPLDRVVAQAVQRSAALRTRDAALLADQLEAVLRQSPFSAPDLALLIEEVEQRELARRAGRRELRREERRRELREEDRRAREREGAHGRQTQTAQADPDPDDSVEITQPRHELRDRAPEPRTPRVDEGAQTFELGPAEAAALREPELATTFYVSKEHKDRPASEERDDRVDERAAEGELELARTHYVEGQRERVDGDRHPSRSRDRRTSASPHTGPVRRSERRDLVPSRERSHDRRSFPPPQTDPIGRVAPEMEDHHDAFVSNAPTMDRAPLRPVETSQLPSLPPPPPPLVGRAKGLPSWLPWLWVGLVIGVALIVATVIVVF
jgi:serine/threonine protein kinase